MYTARSFPSGEVVTAFAVATVFARIFPRLRILFYLVAAMTGVARVVAGGHYISDVVAGAMIGVLVARYSSSLVESFFERRRNAPLGPNQR